MTAYTLAHLVMAGVCAFVGVFYLVMWRVTRGDHVLAWVGVCFFGWVLVDLCAAGASAAAHGALGSARDWGLLVAPALCFLPAGVMRTGWSVMDIAVTRWRAVLLWALVGAGTAKAIEVAVIIHAAGPTFTIESVATSTGSWVSLVFWLFCFAICVVSLVDGISMLRRKRGLALAVVLVAGPVAILFAREVAIGRGWMTGPTLMGVAGLWYMTFAAVVTGARQARTLRSSAAAGGDLTRYHVLRRIGGGGMGETFLATRSGPAGFARHVALKRIRENAAAEPAAIERFLAEARLAAHLRHPNIVAVDDLGMTDDGWFLVMEYVAGVTLAQILRAPRAGAIPPAVAAAIGMRVCRGLGYAHARNVVHRDISPDNVMLSFAGDVKIVDFGIARTSTTDRDAPQAAGHDSSSGSLTAIDGLVGKVPYAAPERLSGEPATALSDLFSLGVLLYQLVAGRRPFQGASSQETAHKILGEPYPPLREIRDDVPPAMEEVIDRLLARRPSGRPASAEEVERALRDCLDRIGGADLGEWMRGLFPEQWAAEHHLELGAAPATAVAPVAGEPSTMMTGETSAQGTVADVDPTRTLARDR